MLHLSVFVFTVITRSRLVNSVYHDTNRIYVNSKIKNSEMTTVTSLVIMAATIDSILGRIYLFILQFDKF